MVPLAEAWDSDASTRSAQERQDYANDIGDTSSCRGERSGEPFQGRPEPQSAASH